MFNPILYFKIFLIVKKQDISREERENVHFIFNVFELYLLTPWGNKTLLINKINYALK